MSTIIAILIVMGLLNSASDWDSLTNAQQEEMIEIVNQDIEVM